MPRLFLGIAQAEFTNEKNIVIRYNPNPPGCPERAQLVSFRASRTNFLKSADPEVRVADIAKAEEEMVCEYRQEKVCKLYLAVFNGAHKHGNAVAWVNTWSGASTKLCSTSSGFVGLTQRRRLQ